MPRGRASCACLRWGHDCSVILSSTTHVSNCLEMPIVPKNFMGPRPEFFSIIVSGHGDELLYLVTKTILVLFYEPLK